MFYFEFVLYILPGTLHGSTYPHRPGIFALYISQTPSGTDQIDYHFLKMLLSIDHLQKEQKYPIYVTGKALLAKNAIRNEQKKQLSLIIAESCRADRSYINESFIH